MSKSGYSYKHDDIPVLMPVLPNAAARKGWEGQCCNSRQYCDRVHDACKKVRVLYRKACNFAVDDEALKRIIIHVAECESIPVDKLFNVITRGNGHVPAIYTYNSCQELEKL